MSNEQMQAELLNCHYKKKISTIVRRDGNICVSYNRVSSKDQMVNGNSLEWQDEQIIQYAAKNKLAVKSKFGGTYESAKTDERKEFQRMLAEIKKNKSIASILVYCYDRFSRSGTNGIFLLENLRSLGVRIISVSQEIDTETPTGMFQENLFMLLSKLDNDMRKDKCVAGTRSLLQKGYWPYATPLGYQNKSRYTTADKHEYIITEQGLLLRQAFKMKASGKFSNQEIVNFLNKQGLKTSLRNLAWILSNTFYCGYVHSKLLPGELIKGKHPAIIDEKTFIKANNIRKQNPRAGIPRSSKQNDLSLKVFVKDELTLSPFTGYKNKKKNLYYYKARGAGICVNISATKLNKKFAEELTNYEYDKQYKLKLKEAIKNEITSKLKDKLISVNLNNKRISELQNLLDRLEERFILDEISKEQFEKFSKKYIQNKLQLKQENEESDFSSSNLEKAIIKAMEIAENISKIWVNADFTARQRLQYLLFPEGVEYNKENDTVRTNVINSLFAPIPQLAHILRTKERGDLKIDRLFGSEVGMTGFEPATPTSRT
jgi:site-specific DNA recombinase